MVASFSISARFTAKFEWVFVLTQENAFSQRFHFKASGKITGSSKKRYQRFLKQPRFEIAACFFVTITGTFERFQYFNFEINFLKNTNPISKKWSTVFQLKVQRQKTQHFHTKLLSEANARTNRMGSTTKRRVLPVTLFYQIFCFSLRTSYKEFV